MHVIKTGVSKVRFTLTIPKVTHHLNKIKVDMKIKSSRETFFHKISVISESSFQQISITEPKVSAKVVQPKQIKFSL